MDKNWIFDMPKGMIGFDKMFETITKASEGMAKAAGYPPYNVVKVDENKYVIEMAVAGFGKNNLDIDVSDGTLTVKGGYTIDQLADSKDIQYLYKGIADRVFTRKFTLSDTVEVKNAELVNGMLKIWLENLIPDHKKAKKVEIKD